MVLSVGVWDTSALVVGRHNSALELSFSIGVKILISFCKSEHKTVLKVFLQKHIVHAASTASTFQSWAGHKQLATECGSI